MIDLEQAEERAKRMLDGMTVNRDVMAREHLAMVQELRQLRAFFEKDPLGAVFGEKLADTLRKATRGR